MSEDPKVIAEEQALAWFVRLRAGDASEADRARCRAWLAADPMHRAAWAELRHLWDVVEVLRPEAGRVMAGAVPARLGRRALWRPAAIAAGVTLVLGAGGLVGSRAGWLPAVLSADVSTRIGERRHLELADGSQAELDAASALALDIVPPRRRVVLLEGRGFFTVAPAAQPFIVAAGEGEVQAARCAFDIGIGPQGVAVTVATGELAVRCPAGEAMLRAGEGLTYDSARLHRMPPADPADIGAWRQGRLVFRGATLREVARTLERYHRGPILITSAAVAGLTLTAVFEADRVEAALAGIERVLPVRVRRVAGIVVLIGAA
ncbi:protein of unknown function [Rhodovastum atsumiense]|uniref:FecR family protein n=1 Tax=Rhodovastum atsumiense TaxID=504468 RepID=UPI00139F2A25|nr:DUF4880 domain-containing protein [Rhodovastum atsumiense]CAH2601488.1 protein of unknown function [Rhodovastum atsumiense]